MSAETLQLISVISFIGAGIMLIVTICICIFLKIPKIIGYLTGRTERKELARFRKQNGQKSKKVYRNSKTNKMEQKVLSSVAPANDYNHGGEKISNTDHSTTEELISDTDLSCQEEGLETIALQSPDFSTEVDIIFIHTNEIIE